MTTQNSDIMPRSTRRSKARSGAGALVLIQFLDNYFARYASRRGRSIGILFSWLELPGPQREAIGAMLGMYTITKEVYELAA